MASLTPTTSPDNTKLAACKLSPLARISLRPCSIQQDLSPQTRILETSIVLFCKSIEEEPFLVKLHSFPPLLKVCANVSALSEGMQIHSYAIKRGIIKDSYVLNSLMQLYFRCRRSSVAHLLFDKMSERSVVSWNCVIAAYSEFGLWEKVISLFWMMVEEALVKPNFLTLVRVVTACTRCGDIFSGKRIYAYIADSGAPLTLKLGNALMNMFVKFRDIELSCELFDKLPNPDVISWTTLISGYSSIGLIRKARALFDRMPGRNVVAWNAMISGYVLKGLFEEALLLYKQMLLLDGNPDKSTFLSVLSASAKSENLQVGKVIHGYITKVGVDVTLDLLHSVLGLYTKCGQIYIAELLFKKMEVKNEISWTLMMTGYVVCGQIDVAMEVFNKMPEKDISSWNALITILAHNHHSIEALSIFKDMLRMKVTPNSLTVVTALSCCTRIGALESGKWIHLYVLLNKFKIDARLSASLIDMYAKCGCIDSSLQVFYRTPQKDLLVWSAIIRGLAMHGKSKLALEIFKHMEDSGVQPDAIAFLGVLSACSHSGLLEEGFHRLVKMTSFYGISPTAEHYSCLVDMLGRRGLLNEAKDFINRVVGIPLKGDKAIWGALLGACKLHGDIELAEYAANRILEVDPNNSGAYVLLSNVYARESKWDGMRRVRTRMRGKRVKKIPGFSSIEVDNVVHEFFAGDSSRSKCPDIYVVLAGLSNLSKIM